MQRLCENVARPTGRLSESELALAHLVAQQGLVATSRLMRTDYVGRLGCETIPLAFGHDFDSIAIHFDGGLIVNCVDGNG